MKKNIKKSAAIRKDCFNFRFRNKEDINRHILTLTTKTEYDLAN
jgi:hypothetical protein